MKVSIIGAGYVGLVSGACLAEKGHQVTCVDSDKDKVAAINAGHSPIYEEGLDDLLQRNIHRGLVASSDLHAAVLETDVSLIAVGTPFDGTRIDLSQVEGCARQVGAALREKKRYHVVAVKSTVVPGTTEQIVQPILEAASHRKAGVDFGLAMNPEFLREGEAVRNFMFPDRIVIGGIDDRSTDTVASLYSVLGDVAQLRTNTKTAEMIKYTANSLLATMVSFSNEIGNLCATLGDIDVIEVMQGVYLDERLSPRLENGERVRPAITRYLAAGCGFGGSCLPKDVRAIISCGEAVGQPMNLLRAVMEVNQEQPGQVLGLVKKHFPVLQGIRVAVLGLSFKSGTNDMRDSPAIPVIRAILGDGGLIKAYDPAAQQEASRIFSNLPIEYCDDLSNAVQGVEAVILVTSWPEFQRLPEMLAALDPSPVLIDGRRMIQKSSVNRYEGIGLGGCWTNPEAA